MLFNSVIVHAAWRPYDPANVLFESEDPELMPQKKFIAQVAQLLVDLVKASAAQPGSTVLDHSSISPVQGSNTLAARSQDADIRSADSTHASTQSGRCVRSVSPSMTWATPTSAVWQDKSAVALRALSTLNWLSQPDQLQKLTRETPSPLSSATKNFQLCTAAHEAVGEALLRLLHCCLAGELTHL